jgi:hypothetical protein
LQPRCDEWKPGAKPIDVPTGDSDRFPRRHASSLMEEGWVQGVPYR